MTTFWRRLSHWAWECDVEDTSVQDLFVDRAGVDVWLLQYSEQRRQETPGPDDNLMLKTNPKYVLRNHLGELTIQTRKTKKFSILEHMFDLLQSPFDEHPDHASWADFPPDWASGIQISGSA